MPSHRLFFVYPKTGKTHQIRVALKSLGAPILGDTRYGGTQADRVYLHAFRLKFHFMGKEYTAEVWPEWGEKIDGIDNCQNFIRITSYNVCYTKLLRNKEGKDALRDEIRDTVSGFLTKGKIRKVYFTEFMYN